MKQSTFKQLLLLAVILFAGIGNVFGEDAYVTLEMNYDYVADVSFWNKDNEKVASACTSTIGGNLIGFETGNTYRMEIDVYNPNYAINSISVDGTDVTNVFQTNNHYDIVAHPNSNVVVNLVKTTKHITVNRMAGTNYSYPAEFNQVFVKVVDEYNNDYYIHTGDDLPGGKPYQMFLVNLAPDIYTVESITVDETSYDDPGNYVNSNQSIEIPNLSSDITVTLTITKADTKIIDVYRNSALASINLFKITGDNSERIDYILDDEDKVEFEVLPGSSCQLYIYPQNQLAYRITSVHVGSDDVTTDFNKDGFVTIPSISEDKVVNVQVSKIHETKTITVSMESDDGYGWSHGCVRFFDPSRNIEVYFGDKADLLISSTTQMKIVTELGWKVKTMKVDNMDVTNTYNSQGYYEFKNLNADHQVAVELETAKIYKITVNRDQIPEDIPIDVQIDNWGYVNYEYEYEYNEGSFVTLSVPAYVRKYENETETKYAVKILDGNTDITPDTKDDRDYYSCVIPNLSSDHHISLVSELLPSIAVNCIYNNEANNDYLDFSLNNERPWVGQSRQFDKGSDVTFTLWEIPDGKVLQSIKIGNNDITSTFSGSYILRNLTENQVITITLGDADESYYLNAYFDEMSTGTIFIKPEMTEKQQRNDAWINKGSKVTIFVKVPIGYEVSNIHLCFEGQGSQQDVNVSYDPETKEYYYVFENYSDRCDALITTQKKPGDATTEISYSLGSSGMATFCSEYDLDFSKVSGISAYVANRFDSGSEKLMMMKVTEVPAGTGLLIVGTPGTYQIPVKATSLYYQNLLKPVSENTTICRSEWYGNQNHFNYVLNNGRFNMANDTQISAYQAYLSLPTLIAVGAEAIFIEFVDYGDMNGDKKVTVTDAILILDQILTNQ